MNTRRKMHLPAKWIVCWISLLAPLVLMAQTPYAPKELTVEDYERAEDALAVHTSRLVFKDEVRAVWIDDHRFWYHNSLPEGNEFILVDAKSKTKKRAFDHEKLAKSLSDVSGTAYSALGLPFSQINFSNSLEEILFRVGGTDYSYSTQSGKCTILPQVDKKAVKAPANSNLSPDGSKAAFIRDYNLWVKDMQTGQETRLTQDGIEDFGYATNNAGWTKSNRPVLLWSPDSKKIATFQHDGRGVGEMYLVTTNVGHPKLEAWKYPLPGDSLIFRIHRVVIHLDGPKVVRLQMPPDPHRSSTTDHIAGRGGNFLDVEWSEDGNKVCFLSNSRDHKEAVLRIADAETGVVRQVYQEKEETFFESGSGTSNWHVFPEKNEFVWFSKRSDWGHLYLGNLQDGMEKNPITKGNWNVLQVLSVHADQRTVYFMGSGKEPGDPYFHYFYKVNFDGSGLQLLTPDSANHQVQFSPSKDYFVDTYSTPSSPPVSVLRDKAGKKILTLEEADISRLLATGWQPPVSIMVKARDGVTDLYGVLFKPKNFDPQKKYPVVNYIYPGPQTGSVGSRSFSASRRDNQAIANLGFIVVSIDAMGTPGRSKSFHDAYYGNMGDNGLPDQVAGMKQLAARYAWIDLERAGIYGHSGGGFASTSAILQYPDFFKVAVSGAGNHDNRNYEDDWGEKWQGLLHTNPDGTTNYDNQANQLKVENLKGKLLLAHGTMDANVPPYNTLIMVDKLIEANKDFDLLMLPNRGHGFGNEDYMLRRRWDYFVQNLLGATPPKEFKFKKTGPRP